MSQFTKQFPVDPYSSYLMIMTIRIVLITLFVNMAAVFASERHGNYITLLRGAGGGKSIPGLIGAEQLVGVRSDRRQPTVTSCTYSAASNTCPAGYYCSLSVGVCTSQTMPTGVCKVVSNNFCTADYTPQCGCDGKTYSNACTAANAGANIAYEGECSTMEPELETLMM